ncbi:MAG: ribulose-phosphate 3-epimerase [Candidatus Babeliales bacterium]|nr:ribulose-phosphate 3-epimerase [Candidatus Babeliales bacterium]
MIKIYPSIISAKILELNTQIKTLEPYCAGFHVDIMDLHFVPNLTMGPDFINAIEKITSAPLWVHLMVDDPRPWLELLKLKPSDIITFHFESLFRDPTSIKLRKTKGFIGESLLNEHKKIVGTIHSKNCLASIAINPETPLYDILTLLPFVDQVLIMSVEPGFSGQKFISKIMHKVKELSQYKKENNLSFKIAIDGGVDKNNISELANLGVEDFAIASAIFKTPNPINAIEELYGLTKK